MDVEISSLHHRRRFPMPRPAFSFSRPRAFALAEPVHLVPRALATAPDAEVGWRGLQSFDLASVALDVAEGVEGVEFEGAGAEGEAGEGGVCEGEGGAGEEGEVEKDLREDFGGEVEETQGGCD